MNKGIMISSVLMVTMLLSILGIKKCTINNKELAKIMDKRPYIDPPFANIDIPLEIYKVNATEGGILKFGENTEIHIPRNAFLNKNGLPVSGNVKLGYRECNDPISTLISGIPMELEDGTGDYLQSAGMFEINAWQNDELLSPNPSSQITVKLLSGYDGDDYNLYNLDTENRKWGQTAQSLDVEMLAKQITETETEPVLPKAPKINFDKMAKRAGFVKPEKPVELDKEKFQFRFKTDFSGQPEINIYNGVQWEFSGNRKSEDPTKNRWVLTARWSEMEIVKKLSEGRYRLKLTSRKKVFKTTVKPVFDSEDMAYAEEVYKEKYVAYRSYVDTKKEEARKRRLEQERLARLRVKEMKKSKKRDETYVAFQREISVAGFGWINIDKMIDQNWTPMVALFSAKDMSPIKVTKVYIITDGINSLATYNASEKNIVKDFKIDMNRNNRIMVIDSNSMVYVFKPDYFSKYGQAIKNAKRHNFVSHKKGVKVASATDIKKVLGLHPESANI